MVRVQGSGIVKIGQTIDDKVTSVIPCYKQSKFVVEALDSCLKQTHRPNQIIILLMDPDSWKLKNDLRTRDPSIRVICSSRKLLPSARNICFGIATTDYIVPLDADDTLEPNFIEETRKIRADVVYVGSKLPGCEVIYLPRTPDISTIQIKEKMMKSRPADA